MATPPESNLIQPPATSSSETAPAWSARDLLRSRPNRREATPSISATDGELLMLFTKHQDEEALTRIIERHGPMVWRVCRGVLLHQQDAEDSYQATFLILARNARSIRAGESIAGWLYRVAHRTAISARRRSLKRREERLATEPPAPPEVEFPDLIGRQMVGLLLEELHRLPAKYQTPLVMRYLEGRSRRSIAEATDTTIATVQGQLARGKKLLRSRLVRRGVSLSAAMAIVGGTSRVEAAPVHLITQTTADMSALALGSGSLAASATVLTLYREGARLMFFASLTKPALATTGVLLMALLATPLLADGNNETGATAGPSRQIGNLPSNAAAEPIFLLDASVSEPAIEAPPAMPLLIAQADGAGEKSGATAGLPSSAAAEDGKPTITLDEQLRAEPLSKANEEWVRRLGKLPGFEQRNRGLVDPKDLMEPLSQEQINDRIRDRWRKKAGGSKEAELIEPSWEELDLKYHAATDRYAYLEKVRSYKLQYRKLQEATLTPQEWIEIEIDAGRLRAEKHTAAAEALRLERELKQRALGVTVRSSSSTAMETRSVFDPKRPTPENGGVIEHWPNGELKAEHEYLNGRLVAAIEYSVEGTVIYEMDDAGPHAEAPVTRTGPAPLLDKPPVPPTKPTAAHDKGRWRVIHKPSAVHPGGWVTIAEVKVGATVPILLPNDQRPRPHLKIIEIGDAGCSFRIENSQGDLSEKLYLLHVNLPRIDEIAGQKVHTLWLAGSRDTHALLLIRQVTGAGFASTPNNLEKMVRHLLDNPNEPAPAPLPPNYNLVPAEITAEAKPPVRPTKPADEAKTLTPESILVTIKSLIEHAEGTVKNLEATLENSGMTLPMKKALRDGDVSHLNGQELFWMGNSLVGLESAQYQKPKIDGSIEIADKFVSKWMMLLDADLDYAERFSSPGRIVFSDETKEKAKPYRDRIEALKKQMEAVVEQMPSEEAIKTVKLAMESLGIDNPLGPGGFPGRNADYGYSVELLQKSLNEQLNPSPQLNVDGDYGPNTDAAVRRFQKAKGLKVDGDAGPGTRKALGLTDERVSEDATMPETKTTEPLEKLTSQFESLLIEIQQGIAQLEQLAGQAVAAAIAGGPEGPMAKGIAGQENRSVRRIREATQKAIDITNQWFAKRTELAPADESPQDLAKALQRWSSKQSRRLHELNMRFQFAQNKLHKMGSETSSPESAIASGSKETEVE